MNYRVPGFSYPGGKVKLREWLVRHMPVSGGKYVEPFAGRGNVFWWAVHVLDYKEWWLNDPWTCRWFEAIQAVDLRAIPNELSKMLTRLYRERAVHHRDEDDEAVALEDVTMFSGGAKAGVSNMWQVRPSLDGFKKRLHSARAILRSVKPKITDFEWEDCGLEHLSAEDFVYLDPPYQTARKDLYHHDTVNHEELLLYLISAPHLWMLSGYSSPLYRRMIGQPEAEKVYQMLIHQHHKGESPIMRQECLWTNYTIGADGVPKRKRLKMRRIHKKLIGK